MTDRDLNLLVLAVTCLDMSYERLGITVGERELRKLHNNLVDAIDAMKGLPYIDLRVYNRFHDLSNTGSAV